MNELPSIRPWRFSKIEVLPLDRVTIRDKHFIHGHVTENARSLVSDDEFRLAQSFTHEEFYDLYMTGEVRIERNYHSQVRSELRRIHGEKTIEDFPTEEQNKAHYLVNLFDAYDQVCRDEGPIPRTQTALKAALPRLSEMAQRNSDQRGCCPRVVFSPPTPSTFKRQYRKYVQAERDIMAIVSRRRGPSRRAFLVSEDARALWLEHAHRYASPRKPSYRNVFDDLLADIHERNVERRKEGLPKIAKPGLTYFTSLIKSLDKFYVKSSRDGIDKARKYFTPTNRGTVATRLGERAEMDEWKTDLVSLLIAMGVWKTLSKKQKDRVPRVRVWVTAIEEVAAKYLLALKFSLAPSVDTAIDAIEMMVSDKTPLSHAMGALTPWAGGLVPWQLVMDQGGPFVSNRLKAKLRELGVTIVYPPARSPAKRGHVESLFKGFSVRFMRWFDGRTFSDVVEKGDYNPAKAAAATVDFLNKNFVIACVDVYHNTPHASLAGETPHNCFVRLSEMYEVPAPLAPQDRARIFGLKFTGTITRNGITLFGIRYTNEKIVRKYFKDREVEVEGRIGRHNIDSIQVKVDGKWATLPNTIGIKDVSLYEWKAAMAEVKAEHAAGAAVSLDTMYAAINKLRKSGDAAADVAEIGLRRITEEWVEKEKNSLIIAAGLDVGTDDYGPGPLVERAAPEDILMAGMVEFDYDEAAEEIAEQAARQATSADGVPYFRVERED